MNKKILETLKNGKQNSTIRCFIITNTDRAFCAGQDLKNHTPDQKNSLRTSLREKYNPMIQQIQQMKKIVIATINKITAGTGCNLALSYDLKIASKEAKFIQSFVHIGLTPDSNNNFILPHLIKLSKTMELLLLD